jgi:hypothetical protein
VVYNGASKKEPLLGMVTGILNALHLYDVIGKIQDYGTS